METPGVDSSQVQPGTPGAAPARHVTDDDPGATVHTGPPAPIQTGQIIPAPPSSVMQERSLSLPAPGRSGVAGWMSDPATIFSALFIVAGASFAWWVRARAGVMRTAAATTCSSARTPTRQSDKAAELRALIEAADERIAILRALAAKEAAAPRPSPVSGIERKPMAPAPLDAFTRRVYDLADSGRSPVDIASELGEHTGKIELILALRRRSLSP